MMMKERMRVLETLKDKLGSSRGKIIANWSIYALGGFLPQALSVLLLPVFTRYLSPHDYGILSYTSMLCTFFILLGSFSIQTYIIRHYYDCKTSHEIRRFFGTIFIFILGYNVLLLGFAYMTLPVVFRLFNVQVPFAPYMQLALISTVIEILGLIPMNYFRAKEQAGKYVTLALVMTLLNGGLSVYLVVVRDMGLLGRYYGQLGANVVLLVVYLTIMARIATFSWDRVYIHKAMAFCLPLVPAQFLAAFTNMSDRLILERYISLAELGLYSVGFAIASSVVFIVSGIYSAIQPRVCRMASESELDNRVLSIKHYVLVVVMSLMCTVIALSRDMVRILAAVSFYNSYKIACLLVISIVMQAFITLVPSLYLMAANKTKYESPIRFVGTLIGFITMLILVPWLGVYGAAISSIVMALATLYSYQFVLRRQSPVHWEFTRDIAFMGGACILGYGILQIETPIPVLTVGVKLSLIGVILTVYILRTTGFAKTISQNIGFSKVLGKF